MRHIRALFILALCLYLSLSLPLPTFAHSDTALEETVEETVEETEGPTLVGLVDLLVDRLVGWVFGPPEEQAESNPPVCEPENEDKPCP